MRQKFFCMAAALFFTTALYAQETGRDFTGGIFPLTLLLEESKYAGMWQPDWPMELPPDAFKVHAGEISRITIEGDGYNFSLSFGYQGRVEEFPFMINGRLTQVSIVYGENMEINELTLTYPAVRIEGGEIAEDSWKMEFLQYSGTLPYLVRVYRSGVWYFIYFTRGVNEILETWYDVDGNALGAYSFSFADTGGVRRIRVFKDLSFIDGATEYYYDSRGFVSETHGPGGFYRVLFFREDLPRYWEFIGAEKAGNYSLQWDDRDLLVRVRGEPERAEFVDFRYDYTLDRKGNWIERRETRMIRYLDLLVPSPGTIFRRVLEYRE